MIKHVKRMVVKVGTSSLTYDTGRLNLRRIRTLAEVLSDLMNSGIEVALVSSGAIGVGSAKLGLKSRPKDTPGRQAAATVGQCELMFVYDKMFGEYGHTVGQLLVTRSDIENSERRENLVNCFEKLFEYNAIPVINENDSVAVEEIVYGDNDNLSAQVARLMGADVLLILSDIDGFFSANPAEDESAVLIPVVERIDETLLHMAGPSVSHLGTGGMATKLGAAQLATQAGIDTIIMNGSNPEDIYRLLDGRQVGTHFKKQSKGDEEHA